VATNVVDKTTRVISDVSITGAVKAKILATKSLTGTAIDVTTRKGVVTLAGTVKNAAQKSAATRLAQTRRESTRL
jgi:osmotically-inducible protein OsmY